MDVGVKVVVLYRGENRDESSEYRGVVEAIKTPKNGNGQMAIVKLENGDGYRSFYLDKVERLEVVS
jgi:hypothetical protein